MTVLAPRYAEAGVDIDSADRAVSRIKTQAARTARSDARRLAGGFAAGLELDLSRWREPVLVTSTDGVGTKLLVAQMLDRYECVGIDLVAMCVNDLITCGAEPLCFLDYIATGRLREDVVARLVAGMTLGCIQAGCSLVGGETAEMPGLYQPDGFDIAGFALGAVERTEALDSDSVRPGDAVIGLASTGLHSNGFSLVRSALLDSGLVQLDQEPPGLGRTLGDELLQPTRIYTDAAAALQKVGGLRALAHITGGGLTGNLPRVVPGDCAVVLKRGTWTEPGIFELVQRAAGVSDSEMFAVFNMGVGMTAIVDASVAELSIAAVHSCGVDAWHIGDVVAGSDGHCEIEGST